MGFGVTWHNFMPIKYQRDPTWTSKSKNKKYCIILVSFSLVQFSRSLGLGGVRRVLLRLVRPGVSGEPVPLRLVPQLLLRAVRDRLRLERRGEVLINQKVMYEKNISLYTLFSQQQQQQH